MIQSVLDKRTFDERLFDIDCSDLLGEDETIVGEVVMLSEIPASADNTDDPPVDVNAAGFTFGAPVVNAGPLVYPRYRYTADPGKVIQVMISGGVLPPGVDSLLCTIRARFATTDSPHVEATVQLRLIDSAP